MIRKKRVS